MEKNVTIKVRTNANGWEDATLVKFLPSRILVRLADGNVVRRRKDDVQMSDLAKAQAIAFDLRETPEEKPISARKRRKEKRNRV